MGDVPFFAGSLLELTQDAFELMRKYLLLMLLAIFPALAGAVPFWGAQESRSVETAPGDLKPGEYVWNVAAAPDGPIVVLVSLGEQRAYVYRNGVQIGFTTISTGKGGYETPTGVFVVLQKDKDHRSKTYNNAADALHAEAHLERRGAACWRLARLSVVARLRAFAVEVLGGIVRDIPDGYDGGGRRRQDGSC